MPLGILMGDPDVFWLNLMNAGLGLTVLGFALMVALGAVREWRRGVGLRGASRSR
jgi:hypothetical protein